MINWSRHGGYECSSKGDTRFSALYARLADGRTIEEHYQCDVKGYQPGGRNWRLGKGKMPLLCGVAQLWPQYLDLWKEWALNNPTLVAELRAVAALHDDTLSDRFATSQVNQARALACILNGTNE